MKTYLGVFLVWLCLLQAVCSDKEASSTTTTTGSPISTSSSKQDPESSRHTTATDAADGGDGEETEHSTSRNYFPVEDDRVPVEGSGKTDLARSAASDDIEIVHSAEPKEALAPAFNDDDEVVGFDEELSIDELKARQEELRIKLVDGVPHDQSGLTSAGFKLPLDEKREGKILIVDHNTKTSPDTSKESGSWGQEGVQVVLLKNDKIYSADDDVVLVSAVSDNDVDCFASRDQGTCNKSIESYFYDHGDNKCHFFIYSGCGGNSNRFATEAECIRHCGDAQPSAADSSKKVCNRNEAAPICKSGCALIRSDVSGCLECDCQVDKEMCLDEPGKRGFCKAALKYYTYYKETDECRQFLYGGCEAGANRNKFQTKELCEAICRTD